MKICGQISCGCLISLSCLLIFSGCRDEKKSDAKFNIQLDLKKIKEIKLIEDKNHVIGKIFQIEILADSVLFILDMTAADIKKYDINGNYIETLFKRGNGPNELRAPRALKVNQNSILVGDIGFDCTKWFSHDGKLIRQVFVDRTSVAIGNIEQIDNFHLLHGALRDPQREFKQPLYLIDTSGNVKKKLGSYPEEYKDFDLDGTVRFDVHPSGTFFLSFLQSPALYIGTIYSDEGKMFPNTEKRTKYISKNRSPQQRELSIQEAEKLACEEAYNYKVIFWNDSLLLRAYSRPTEESQKIRSMVRHKNFIEIYSVTGEFYGEIQINGRLHARSGNYLVVEENDEPNNRLLVMYKFAM